MGFLTEKLTLLHFSGFTFKLKVDKQNSIVSNLDNVSPNVLPNTRISSRYTSRIWKLKGQYHRLRMSR